MGTFLAKLIERITGVKEVRLLMLGLDNAGKTTILYKLKFDQTVTTVPTVGFNVECLMIRNIRFNVWDVGGQDKIRPLWRHYFTGTNALVFVVDSQDRDRLDEARLELNRIVNDREMRGCWLLVFANKQDLEDAMSVEEVKTRLNLESMLRPNTWLIQPSCATTGSGLIDGFNWLAQSIRSEPRPSGSTARNASVS